MTRTGRSAASPEPDPRLSASPGDRTPSRLGHVLGLAAKRVRERFDQQLRADGGSFARYMVLSHAESAPLSQRALAARVGIEAPTLVRHLDRLVAEGLVVRVADPSDRRVSLIELTTEGGDALARSRRTAERFDADLRGLFSEGELATLFSYLRRIQAHYVKENDGFQLINSVP